MTDLRRRHLLQAAALLPLAAACGRLARAADDAPATARFVLDAAHPGRTVDPSLASLSYEMLELENPRFFAADNHALVQLFRALNPNGVLRIGGNTSDDTVWAGWHGSLPPFVARKRGLKQPFVLKPEALAGLAGFLKATGWKLVFGVNLRIGVPAMAAALAKAVQQAVGDDLLAIQIGNEANNYFADYATFRAAWEPYAAAIRAVGAPLAGPDTGANTDWVIDYADAFARENVFLSRHYYRDAAPAGSIPNLLQTDTAFLGEVDQLMRAADRHALPLRLTEANSYYFGGADGVSNVFASALWAADFMLALASRGVAGVHFHGGTLRSVEASLGRGADADATGDLTARRDAVSSRYSAIAGDAALGFQPRPIFHGIELAQRFAGARLLGGQLAAGGVNLTAYAAQRDGSTLVALINKDAARDATVALGGLPPHAAGSLSRLRAPALDSRRDVSFADAGPVAVDAVGACRIRVPRGSAVLGQWPVHA